jgi:phosphoribosylformylglycinamidine cyclo-ligase
MVDATGDRRVLSSLGSFGGLYASPGREKALVASTDGVGTKLKVAVMAGRHDTIGRDLVNHCVNDILVQGARPLFFLDYIGTAKLSGEVFRDILTGLCRACRENHCALLGGETAEMPGLYPEGEYDLVGTILGAVDRKKIVTGATIRPGDVIIGLRSSGLHTNGYSLARKVLFEQAGLKINDVFPGVRARVSDVLLAVHRSYLRPVSAVLNRVKVRGMVHITGGGFQDNIPRVLPENTGAVIDLNSWKVPPLFQFIQSAGKVDRDEMYRVFNMGLGFMLIVRRTDAARTIAILKKAKCRPVIAGYIREGSRDVQLAG